MHTTKHESGEKLPNTRKTIPGGYERPVFRPSVAYRFGIYSLYLDHFRIGSDAARPCRPITRRSCRTNSCTRSLYSIRQHVCLHHHNPFGTASNHLVREAALNARCDILAARSMFYGPYAEERLRAHTCSHREQMWTA